MLHVLRCYNFRTTPFWIDRNGTTVYQLPMTPNQNDHHWASTKRQLPGEAV